VEVDRLELVVALPDLEADVDRVVVDDGLCVLEPVRVKLEDRLVETDLEEDGLPVGDRELDDDLEDVLVAVIEGDVEEERDADLVDVIVFVGPVLGVLFAELVVVRDTEVDGLVLRVKVIVFEVDTEAVPDRLVDADFVTDRVAVIVLLGKEEPVGFLEKLGVLEVEVDMVLVLVSERDLVPKAELLVVCVVVIVFVLVGE
jgi:hypothetical protein